MLLTLGRALLAGGSRPAHGADLGNGLIKLRGSGVQASLPQKAAQRGLRGFSAKHKARRG